MNTSINQKHRIEEIYTVLGNGKTLSTKVFYETGYQYYETGYQYNDAYVSFETKHTQMSCGWKQTKSNKRMQIYSA